MRSGPTPTPQSGDPEPAPDRSVRPSGPGVRRWGIAGFVCLVAVLLLGVRPAYRRLEHWRAMTLVSQASELAGQKLFTEAINRYQSALRLDPAQLDGLRGLADIYSKFETPAALPTWRAVLAIPGHTEEDVRNYIEFTLRAQRFDLAEAELSKLLAGTNISTATRTLAVDFFQRQGNTDRALAFAQEILHREPGQLAHELRVIRAMVALPDAARQREGLARLERIPTLSAEDRLGILRALESAPGLPEPETSSFLNRLPPLPAAPPLDVVKQADLRIRLEPGSRSNHVQSAIEALRGGSPDAQWTLCQWLNKNREYDALLASYSLEHATNLPPILPLYLDALGLSNRWEELQRAASHPLPVEPWLLEAYRAVAATRLKQETLSRELWRRTFELAKQDLNRIQVVGDLSLRMKARDKAIEAFNLLANDDLHRTAGYRRLAQTYEDARDTEQLRLLMREWSANAPDDPTPNAAYAYLSALLRRDLDDARGRAQLLVDRFPARPTHRAALAFLELRRNQPQAALQILERSRTDLSSSAQLRLVHALILEANGQAARAREIARSIRTESLLPEEQDLVRRLIGPAK